VLTGLVYALIEVFPYSLLGARDALAILCAMLVLTLVNHLMVGLVIKWARGQNLSQSGVFTLTTLTIDFGLLCLGASAAFVAQINVWAILFLFVVAYLLQSALHMPALERKSEQDAKTGLYNAEHFNQMVQKELQRAQKQARPLAVVMADLDRLRDLNNTYGHLAGDAVIKKIAQILQASVREQDLVARFGGEEYGILLPDTTAEEAYVQVEAMRKAVEAAEFTVSTHEAPIKATMSFGIAQCVGSEQGAKEILHQADIAVYHAKHTGRNRVCIYHPEYNTLSVEQIPLASEVRQVEEPLTSTTKVEDAPTQTESPIRMTATEQSATKIKAATQEAETVQSGSATIDYKIHLLIGGMIAGAASLVGLIIVNGWPLPAVDWTALLVFALLALILEIVALEVYSADTSVSTSVAPVLAATLAFGIVGAAVTSLVVTSVTQLRHRKPLNRFIFNVCNHLIGSSLCLILLQFDPLPLFAWPTILQVGFTLLAACIIYASTTLLLAGVISLSGGEQFFQVWQERFRWLGLYYIALGLVAYVLLYSYYAVGVLSVVTLFVPFTMIYLSQRQYIKATKSMVKQLHATNATLTRQSEDVQRLNEELLLALASTIDLRDPYVVEHSRHVARYAALIAGEFGLPPAQVKRIYQAGLMHDIGKLAIPEAILFKPGGLTPEEYEVIKEHVTVGADLLDDFQSLQHMATFVRYHHERYDGRGYPNGLAGEQIPIEARILALADAVEAMASDRPYRQGSSPGAILLEIQKQAGVQFDPLIVEAFVRLVQTKGAAIIVNSARTLEIEGVDHALALHYELAFWASKETS
jgi:diguanylate cyclase (GGDEF)-like protein/putative nucleotidyltransferase with HDIG domain